MAFRITQGDTSPALVSTLSDDETAIDLTNATDVRFIMENKYQEVVIDEGTADSVNVIDAADGEVEFVFTSDQTATAGTYRAEWEVEDANGNIETFPTGNKIRVEIVEEIG